MGPRDQKPRRRRYEPSTVDRIKGLFLDLARLLGFPWFETRGTRQVYVALVVAGLLVSAVVYFWPERAGAPHSRANGTEIDDTRFWAVLESTAPESSEFNGRGSGPHVEAIQAALRKLPPAQIVAFDHFLRRQLDAAYRWDLWAVAYIAMGGCSDDSFEYFRLWLIAQGRDYFERALRDPPRAVDTFDRGRDGSCEELLYAAGEAYTALTGSQIPRAGLALSRTPKGTPWGEGDVASLYPELARRFDFSD